MSEKKPVNLKPLIYMLYGGAAMMLMLGGVLLRQEKSTLAATFFILAVVDAVIGIVLSAKHDKLHKTGRGN